jgi:alkanesulfonate monooxygenase SsuD/methylene tetrahydromethanopterin reductase-like flavin-dependent oxidoreductase (luciferase family)
VFAAGVAGPGEGPTPDVRPRTSANTQVKVSVRKSRRYGTCVSSAELRLTGEWVRLSTFGRLSVAVLERDGVGAGASGVQPAAVRQQWGTHPRRLPQEPPLEKCVIAGTPEEVAEHARSLIDAGAYRVEFGTPQGLTTRGGVDLLCDRVLPLLTRG